LSEAPDRSSANAELPRINRFTLLEPIAVGGMGELYAAYDAKLDRKIAIKLVRTGRGGQVAEARLLREAQALAKLSHPNIVTVYEAGIDGDRVFVTMEYVRGQTLSAWLASIRSRPEPERVAALLARFADAGRGLEAIHRAGLAHRDFKPDNVLVGDDGRVRVVDFGLARSVVDPPEPTTVRNVRVRDILDSNQLETDRIEAMGTPELDTVTGTVIGTPRYMAPEQWLAQRGDGRSDQFAFCVALYFALYDGWPFAGDATLGLRSNVIDGNLCEPPRKPEVPARLHAALLRGLACEPDDRFPSMAELLAAIDEAQAPRRRVRVAAALGAVGLALVFAWLLQRPSPTPPVADDPRISIEREIAAERRRLQIESQVAALRSKGEHAEADAVFEAFASQREYDDTRALAIAWLDQAGRLRERGDRAGELAALGRAQLASWSDDLRRRALIELARAFQADHRYGQLGAVLELLDRLGGEVEPAQRSELLAMQIHEAASRRDFASALEMLREPGGEAHAELRPLFDQLARAHATEHVALSGSPRGTALAVLPSLDRDGDGQGELVLASADGLRLLGSSPDLPVLQALDPVIELEASPSMPVFVPIAPALGRVGAPDWIASRTGGQWNLLALAPEGDQVAIRTLPIAVDGIRWATGDLFTNPGWSGWEAWGADAIGRRLTGLRGEEPEAFVPEPGLEALRSVVQDIAIADLDGEGSDELIVGVGAWWAYDVRVLSPDHERPGEFETVARRKLGEIDALTAFPALQGPGHRIAVTLSPSFPSPRTFPSERPSGEPSGVYVLSWDAAGRSLDIVDRVALPISFRPGAADLDGDGRSELIVQMLSAIAILHAGADDRYAPIWLDGLHYHAIVDLDGDGDDELIVSEPSGEAAGRLIVLGSGDQRIRLADRRTIASVEPPAELDGALAEMWGQAEALATIGLSDEACSVFDDLARLASPNAAALAHRRAAELDERLGTGRRAAELYERAGDPDSLARAVEIYERRHEFDDAARVARRSALDQRPGRAEALDRLATPADAMEFDFRQPLDAGWRIARPGLLRREPGGEFGGLRVESLGAGEPLLMRRAIVWTGERLEVEVELDLLRMEWASGLTVELIALDESGRASAAPVAELVIDAWGGGDHYMLDLCAGMQVEPGAVGINRAMRGAMPPAGQHRFRMRMDLLAGSDRVWTEVTTIDGTGPRDTAFDLLLPSRGPLRPGRYELRVRTGIEPWVRGAVRLERMRVLGARDDLEAAPASAREQVLLALANDASERALELLDRSADELDPRDAAWLRALALEQLGRWPEAVPFIEAAIGECRSPDELARFGHALLLQPDRMGPTLRRICRPDDYLLGTWSVTRTSAFQHRDLYDLHRTLTTQLGDLDRHEPADLDQALATIDLLTSRARGWLMQDAASAAESDLRRVIELSERWLDSATLDDEQRQQLQRLRSIAHVELAVVLMTRARTDEAGDELERALASDPAPEIIADVIMARTAFERLESTPVWARIGLAQLGRGDP
jgi:serine/threonine protein kinase/tetratricopeptide (TPR) repeat protein